MNANELAVELEHYLKGEEYDRLVWEIPDLLRQQQAELDALKKLVHQRFDDGKRLGIIETEDRLRKAQEK